MGRVDGSCAVKACVLLERIDGYLSSPPKPSNYCETQALLQSSRAGNLPCLEIPQSLHQDIEVYRLVMR